MTPRHWSDTIFNVTSQVERILSTIKQDDNENVLPKKYAQESEGSNE